jgi:stage III sporulation protein AF
VVVYLIDSIKNWIINITTAVFFITAVEMLLPNNNLKKYAKFVLGLILITVLIAPIIKMFDRNYDISAYESKAENYFDSQTYENNANNYVDENEKNTLNAFELNVKNLCEKKLKVKFPKYNCTVDLKADYDSKSQMFEIKSIEIGVNDRKVQKIKKVQINTKANEEDKKNTLNNEFSNSIKNYLSEQIGVEADIITVYKT